MKNETIDVKEAVPEAANDGGSMNTKTTIKPKSLLLLKPYKDTRNMLGGSAFTVNNKIGEAQIDLTYCVARKPSGYEAFAQPSGGQELNFLGVFKTREEAYKACVITMETIAGVKPVEVKAVEVKAVEVNAVEVKNEFSAAISGCSVTITNSADPSYHHEYKFNSEAIAIKWAERLVRHAEEDAADGKSNSAATDCATAVATTGDQSCH